MDGRQKPFLKCACTLTEQLWTVGALYASLKHMRNPIHTGLLDRVPGDLVDCIIESLSKDYRHCISIVLTNTENLIV